MPALSVRQPYAEQIMRGTKKIEFRSMPTKRRGRVYIYASMTPGPAEVWRQIGLGEGDLPTGVLIGSVEIVDCTGKPGDYHWHLKAPERLGRLLKPKEHPQPSVLSILSRVRSMLSIA